MKELRFRLILILGAVVLSVYLLYPTYVNYQNNKMIDKTLGQKREIIKAGNPHITNDALDDRLKMVEDSIKAVDPSINKDKQKSLKLGLDLQGGMRVVLEVNTGKLLEKLAKSPDDVIKQILAESEKTAAVSNASVVDLVAEKLKAKGIRLSRYYGNIREDDSQIISDLKKNTEDAVSRAMEIIRNRVDQYGVSEPSIQREGTRRIIVELPGVAREEEAKQLLQGTALLEFKMVKDPEFTISVMKKIDDVLAGNVSPDSTLSDTTTANSKTQSNKETASKTDTSNKQMTAEEFTKKHPFFSVAILDQRSKTADAYVKADERDKLKLWLSRPDVQKVIPDNCQFVFSAKPFGIQNGQPFYVLYCVDKNPELTGGVITNAVATISPETSAPIVNMEMNSEGASDWARITGANIHKRIAIVLDGVVYSAPVVNQKITGGRSQIEGMADLKEAQLLAIVLKAGALPAPVDIIEERTVGPSLGQDSINDGVNSTVIGFLVVSFFMIIYYQRAGTIAAASLVFTILFILGALAGFNATLTLPGIAGIILTIGMAVDANVLIYERIREELETGKTIKASVDSGFSKAYSAIIDSNITTFITAVILYQFGTGPVQGFALTLMIGLVASLFSALIIARVVFDYMVQKGLKISLG
ncbi:MAG: protein translocase subunit SecD [Bacteroidetes bacterium]|nr:protein translocase subunit SecD [Bacteroidota bacterium]